MPRNSSILVVDDNAAALKATVRILQQAGYTVAQAADGEDGLRHIRALRPRLVLLDVVLPGISGTEVLRQIRADPTLAGVSVVLLSSMAINPDQQAAGLDAGADGYITRPIANAELLARVRSHLRQLQLTDQLRASEEKSQQLAERLTTTLESLTDGFFTLDRDWHFTYVNHEAERMFGQSRADLLGKHIWESFPEARGTISQHEYERALRDNVPVQFDTFYPPLGIWFDARAFPSAHGLAVYFRDVTGMRQATEALQESEDRFSGAFEQAPIGVALGAPDGRWLKANRALCELVGYSEAELLTRNVADITPPEDLASSQEQARQLLAGEVRSYQLEKRYIHARGHLVPVLVSVSLVRDEQGAPRYFIVQIQDMTERNRADESLRLLGSAVEQSKEAILITDAELDLPGPKILFVNPAYTRMTGYTAADVMGKTPRLMQGPRTDKAVLRRLRQNLERGEEFAGEAINYRKDGSEYAQEWQIAPIRDAHGKISHFVATQRDITARKQAEAALAEAHGELVDLSRQSGMAEVATGVLHNVGNVLNSVNVSATLVADHVRHSKGAQIAKLAAMFQEHHADLPAFLTHDPRGRMIPGYLNTLAEALAQERSTVIAELDHLKKNVGHIKDIVTMQQSYAKKSGFVETVALTDLIDDALRMNASSLTRHDIELVRDFQISPAISTDKHKIVQILVNLVRNAQHACDEGGRSEKQIIVQLVGDAQRVRISVSDNGVGIPPENLARIFAHGFTTRKEGHGFGLHSGALAARELGGSLSVQSAGPGLGATFVLELPFHPDTSSHENPVR